SAGDAFASAVAEVGAAVDRGPVDVPAAIGGRPFMTTEVIESPDPARPSVIVARSASTTAADADRAIDVARTAWPAWRRTSPRDRAAVLFRAAHWMRVRRDELAALEVFEAGKPWREADADVCEAIDFCEYYGREMIRLSAGATVQSPPGEANSMHYQARGVGAVIAP